MVRNVRNGYVYLTERIDHPAVKPYTVTFGDNRKETRYKAPLRPETICSLMDQEPALEEELDAGYWRSWCQMLERTHTLKNTDIDNISINHDFRYAPYDHQRRALYFSLMLPASALFMETGTGKTFVALHNAEIRLARGTVDKILVVAPSSILRAAWLEDCRKFTDLRPIIVHTTKGSYRWRCPWCDKRVHHISDSHAAEHYKELNGLALMGGEEQAYRKDTDAARFMRLAKDVAQVPHEIKWNEYKTIPEKLAANEFDLYITSPGMLKRNLDAFLGAGFDQVILDESTLIKNPSSKRSKAIHKVGYKARFRLALSGTPITNSVEDIWSQMHFVDQSLGDTVGPFYDKYFFYPNKGQYPDWRKPYEFTFREVPDLISQRVFRARKADCLDLPPRTVLHEELELKGELLSHYQTMYEHMYVWAEDQNFEVTAKMVLDQTLKLLMISNGFIHREDPDDPTKTTPETLAKRPPKLRRLKQLADGLYNDVKFIVWTNFRHDTTMLCEALDDYNPVVLTGKTPSAQMEPRVSRFRDDPSCRCAIAHPESVQYGHTWNWATYSFFYSYSYSVLAYMQARDRNYRIGQDSPVTEIFLTSSAADETVREAIMENKKIGEKMVNAKSIDGKRQATKSLLHSLEM